MPREGGKILLKALEEGGEVSRRDERWGQSGEGMCYKKARVERGRRRE